MYGQWLQHTTQCSGVPQSIRVVPGVQAAQLQQEIATQHQTMQRLVQAQEVQIAEMSLQQEQLTHQVSDLYSPIHIARAV